MRTLRAFLEFCYIARQDIQDSKSLAALKDALARFHRYRVGFQDCGIRVEGFNLPRQHSLTHYFALIRAFGAPNGLCSSITESKHIKAVKEPWRRSNRFEALGQMLLTNQRLDKLAASRADFMNRGMLRGTCLSDKLYKLGKNLHYNTMFSLILMVGTRSGLIDTVQIDDVAGAADNRRHAVNPAQDGDNGDGDDDIIAGPRFLATVELAKTLRTCIPKLTALHIANKSMQNDEHIPTTLQRKSIKRTFLSSSAASSMSNYSLVPTLTLQYHHCLTSPWAIFPNFMGE